MAGQPRGMKRILVAGVVLVVVVGCWAATGEEGFLKSLPAERFRAAGLEKLTAGELAELERLFAEQKAGELAAAVSAAESRGAEQARAAAAPAEATSGRQPGWLRALITLKEVEDKPEAAGAVESRLVGEFKGWSGRTMFRLENGQVWQQAGGGEYVGDTLQKPAVKVYPAAMGGYWLQVEGLRQRVRVKPVKLE